MRITIEDTRSGGEALQVSGAPSATPVTAPTSGPGLAGAIDAGPAPSGPQQATQLHQPSTAAPSGEPMIVQHEATSAGPAPTHVQ